MRTTIRLVAIVVFLFALVTYGVRLYAHWTHTPRPARFASAKRGNLEVQILLTGSVEPKTKMVVKSQFPGKVAKVFVQPGDRVHKGQPIALIESSDLDWQDKRLQSTLGSTLARLPDRVEHLLQNQSLVLDDLIAMESHLRRVERFLTTRPATALNDRIANEPSDDVSGGIAGNSDTPDKPDLLSQASKQEAIRSMEQVHHLLEKIRTKITRLGADEANVGAGTKKRISTRLSRRTTSIPSDEATRYIVKSPISGTIITRNAVPGDIVTGGLNPFGGGQELAVVADTTQMVIRALIPEVDVARVREGQAVDVRLDALQGHILKGRIERIAPAPREQRGALAQFIPGESVWYEVQIHLDESDRRLRTGMTANVDLTAETLRNVIYLPQEALFEEKGRWYVWKVSDNRLASMIHKTTGAIAKDASGNVIDESMVRPMKSLVHVGASNDLMMQIRAGLPQGAVVMIKPPLRGRRTFEIK